MPLSISLKAVSYTHLDVYKRQPDTRFDMLLQDLTEVVRGVDFKVFSEAPAVKAIVVKGAADNYSRKDIDKMTEVAKQYGAKGLAWVKVCLLYTSRCV